MQAVTEVVIYVGETELIRTARIEYEKFGQLVAISTIAFENEEAGSEADVTDMFTQEELEQLAIDQGLTEEESEGLDE